MWQERVYHTHCMTLCLHRSRPYQSVPDLAAAPSSPCPYSACPYWPSCSAPAANTPSALAQGIPCPEHSARDSLIPACKYHGLLALYPIWPFPNSAVWNWNWPCGIPGCAGVERGCAGEGIRGAVPACPSLYIPPLNPPLELWKREYCASSLGRVWGHPCARSTEQAGLGFGL